MTNKKTIHIVCKSNTEDKFRLAYEFWGRLLEKEDLNQLPKDLVIQSITTADKETLESGQCKWFYCPAYHFCPFVNDVLPGVKGRADKKKFDVKFDNVNEQPKLPTNTSDFNFRDGVVDEVIRGNGSVDISDDEIL